MPVYQGGKARLGHRIHKVIKLLEDYLYPQEKKLPYFEPFVGMAGVIVHFGKENTRAIFACDANKDMILMWKALQEGWSPPTKCSKKEYEMLKNSKKNSAERGFIGTVASWSGIFFHYYRLDYTHKDYLGEGYRSLMKMKNNMNNITFLNARSYDEFNPKDFVIYADPPYDGNKLGNSDSLFQKFNHEKFWNDMRDWSKDNLVIISEWKAPEDFKKIWSSESTVSMGSKKTKKYSDNLYLHKNVYEKLDNRIKFLIEQL